jgi:hypothetical protein
LVTIPLIQIFKNALFLHTSLIWPGGSLQGAGDGGPGLQPGICLPSARSAYWAEASTITVFVREQALNARSWAFSWVSSGNPAATHLKLAALAYNESSR